MAWYPTRISTRLTIGGILLLAVTTIVIVVIMLWRGQPRVVEINTALIEETGQGLTRQLSTVLSRIEGETVSMSRLAEVLPNDESLYQSVVPHLIGEGKDSIITGGGTAGRGGQYRGQRRRRTDRTYHRWHRLHARP